MNDLIGMRLTSFFVYMVFLAVGVLGGMLIRNFDPKSRKPPTRDDLAKIASALTIANIYVFLPIHLVLSALIASSPPTFELAGAVVIGLLLPLTIFLLGGLVEAAWGRFGESKPMELMILKYGAASFGGGNRGIVALLALTALAFQSDTTANRDAINLFLAIDAAYFFVYLLIIVPRLYSELGATPLKFWQLLRDHWPLLTLIGAVMFAFLARLSPAPLLPDAAISKAQGAFGYVLVLLAATQMTVSYTKGSLEGFYLVAAGHAALRAFVGVILWFVLGGSHVLFVATLAFLLTPPSSLFDSFVTAAKPDSPESHAARAYNIGMTGYFALILVGVMAVFITGR